MKPVPPRSQHAVDPEADPHVDAANGAEPSDETALLPVLSEQPALPAPAPDGPTLKADPGLYAVLGLDPSVSNWEIQTTYRRMASKLMGSSSRDNQALKQLNVAYEVLGNPGG